MSYFAVQGSYGLGAAQVPEFCILAVIIGGLGIWRHHANIKRLLAGTENKIGAKKKG